MFEPRSVDSLFLILCGFSNGFEFGTHVLKFVSYCNNKYLFAENFSTTNHDVDRFLFQHRWPSRCEFHQHFKFGFCKQKYYVKLFFTYILGLKFFLAREYWCKFAHKMFVKLTTGLLLGMGLISLFEICWLLLQIAGFR